jgi:hypothetical protein
MPILILNQTAETIYASVSYSPAGDPSGSSTGFWAIEPLRQESWNRTDARVAYILKGGNLVTGRQPEIYLAVVDEPLVIT